MNKKRKNKYKTAYRIACQLLNGDVLNGIDKDSIFEACMEKEGIVSSLSYEEYILRHLDTLIH